MIEKQTTFDDFPDIEVEVEDVFNEDDDENHL